MLMTIYSLAVIALSIAGGVCIGLEIARHDNKN